MPTVKEARQMLCPYLAAKSMFLVAGGYNLSNLRCYADSCPKWRWDECRKDTCPNKDSLVDCKDCDIKTGHCG